MYQQMIREALAKGGLIGLNPRHVEAWMRAEHSTLDGLGSTGFSREVKIAADCVLASGEAQSEMLARSFGL